MDLILKKLYELSFQCTHGHCVVSFCLTKGFKVFVLLFHSFQRRSSFIVFVCVLAWACVCVCELPYWNQCWRRFPFRFHHPHPLAVFSTLQHCSHIFINSRALSAIFPWPPTCDFHPPVYSLQSSQNFVMDWESLYFSRLPPSNPIPIFGFMNCKWFFCFLPFALSNHLICRRAEKMSCL